MHTYIQGLLNEEKEAQKDNKANLELVNDVYVCMYIYTYIHAYIHTGVVKRRKRSPKG